MNAPLEVKLQSELDLTWITRTFDPTEIPVQQTSDWVWRAVTEIPIWIRKLRVIEGVEEFSPELEIFRFRDRGFFLDREIEIVEPRATTQSAFHIAKLSQRSVRETVRIEIIVVWIFFRI